uniref:Uncharacterized protein n=1 Tax=Acrobeloides nanus TaxID=290746 RepID=A0A914DY59_9BILA
MNKTRIRSELKKEKRALVRQLCNAVQYCLALDEVEMLFMTKKERQRKKEGYQFDVIEMKETKNKDEANEVNRN